MTEGLSFGLWLKQQRKELDLTQEELARDVGCSAIAIRKIEADEYRPSKQIAFRLAEVLDVQAAERESFVRFARGETTALSRTEVDRQTPWRGMERRRAEVSLPAPLTRLIGREREAAEICAFLRREGARLVTLTGPPGVGKTRLSIEAASQLVDYFNDGLFFVPLASLNDPSLVLSAIAGIVGVKETADKLPAEGLRRYLRDRRMLLVLDNFEQVVEAAPLLEDLLAACGRLVMLVTSRELLHIQGEQQYPIAPLEVPGNEFQVPILPKSLVAPYSLLANIPSVELFLVRARAVKPDFELTAGNAWAVAAICARLDGLPLAIEIAAARVNLMSCQAMLAYLQDPEFATEGRDSRDTRLQLLKGASRHASARQRTLRGAIEWSYNLLDPAEQKLFTRLAVFRGGYTIAAAEAVCNARGDLEIEVLHGIESLLDKSLVGHEEREDGEDRYTMLETIRGYALEMLIAGALMDGQADSANLKRHHAQYYLALAEAAELELRGTQQAAWLNRLEREHGNLRAALHWSEKHDAGIALRLVAALWRYWWIHGYLSEGREWLNSILVLDHQVGERSIWRARALRGAGWLAYAQGDYVSARALFEQGLALFEQNNDRRGVGSSLDNLGAVDFTLGNNSEARVLYEKSLAIRRELGDKHAIATSLNNLGLVATSQGDYSVARPLLEESLAQYRELEDGYGIATSLNNLALAALCEGEPHLAISPLKESLSIRAGMGDKYAVAYSLAAFAGYAGSNTRDDDGYSAARLLGATHALLDTIGARLENAYRVYYDNTLATVRAKLGEAVFSSAWQEGLAAGMEEAIAYARAEE